MITKTYLLDNNEETWKVIRYIEENLMGFTEYKEKDGVITYTVQVRNEDLAWLEDLLAPIV